MKYIIALYFLKSCLDKRKQNILGAKFSQKIVTLKIWNLHFPYYPLNNRLTNLHVADPFFFSFSFFQLAKIDSSRFTMDLPCPRDDDCSIFHISCSPLATLQNDCTPRQGFGPFSFNTDRRQQPIWNDPYWT